MTIELRILTGVRAGKRERFDQPVITIGRHSTSDLRFDPLQELDVSTRHAELRWVDGAWVAFDQASTNGTFVNGERIIGGRTLQSGDVLGLGEVGPQVEFHLVAGTPPSTLIMDELSPEPEATSESPVPSSSPGAAQVSESAAPAPQRRDTSVRIAEAVETQTSALRRRFAIALGGLVVATGVGIAIWQRQTSARERELLALIAHSESVSVPLQRTITAMQSRDSQFADQLARRSAESAREVTNGRNLVAGSGRASEASVALLSERVALDTRVRQALTSMDIPRVHDLNDSAVALVASDLDGTFIGATAFSVAPAGLLVTNRHVVRSESGNPARRIRVLYANTTEWLPARLLRVSEEDDLALLEVDGGGPYPVVAGVSRAASETRVGSPVASIGFPHAVDTPMEGKGLDVRARTTTTAGMVSKRLGDVLQIDSYAGKGSSGSPVFDVRGQVVGVVYGGAPQSNGRIVYAVPAERLAAFIGSGATAGILR